MRKIFIGLGAFFILLVMIAIIIPFLIPASTYKAAIEEQLSAELARDVIIEGDISVAPFPVVKANAGRVTIANPDGFEAEYFAAMNAMETRIKLIPLFRKRVVIESFKLVDPEIYLEKRADGTANWEFSSTETKPDAGPFKRDGRYASLDPSIGRFILENGTIVYSDATTGKRHNVKSANLQFALPSLSEPVSVEGDLIVNGIGADIDLRVDTPRSFLNGEKTPVDITAKTQFGSVKAKGFFTQSEDIHFVLDINGALQDLKPFKDYIPQNLPIIDIIKTLDVSGRYEYDGQKIAASNADLRAKGPLLDGHFIGDAVISETPTANGKLNMSLFDIPKLTKFLAIENNAAAILQSAVIQADLKAANKGIVSDKVTATLKGEGLDATFNGTGSYNDTLKTNGAFTAKIASIPALAKSMGIVSEPAKALGSANARGTLTLNGKNLSLKLDEAKTTGENITASYKGLIEQTSAGITLNGTFDSLVPSLAKLARAAQTDIPYAATVEAINAKGSISGSPDALNFSNMDIKLTEGQLNGTYLGDAQMNNGVSLNGNLTADIASLSSFAKAAKADIPYANAVNRLSAKGTVTGKMDQLKLSDLDVRLSDGKINGVFKGAAKMENGFDINGTLDAEIPSARELAKITGTDLPPSTAKGTIYERVAVKGQVSGTPSQIKFSNANLAVDEINGGADLILDLQQTKPTLKGTLDLGKIDLRPYMDAYMAQRSESGIPPWSKTPFNFAALRAMDGDYIIKTPEILLGTIQLGQTELLADVRSGVMTTRLPQINLYGGLGVMTAMLDASGEIPKFKMDVKLEDIKSNKFLASIANFTKLEGQGHTVLEITGEGRTQDELMKSLDGYGNFEVMNGVISGIDLSQFLTGIDEALTRRVIPSGLGQGFSTKFNDILGKFNIQDGVVSIDAFNLKSSNALASGAGKLDIGNQSVDFGLRPRLTGTDAGDLAKFGIPLRIKGKWGSIATGLDTDLLTKIAAEKAKQEITDRVGGELGNVLGTVLGGTPRPSTTPGTPPATPSSTPAQTPVQTAPPTGTTQPAPTAGTEAPVEPKAPEPEVPENPAAETPTQQTPAPETPKVEETPKTEPKKDPKEEIINRALGSIFGGKKNEVEE